MIPYGRQTIEEDDIAAVVEVLKGEWLTQGPTVARFEQALCAYTGAKHAVSFANGSLALMAAYAAAGIKAGDEVIVPAITFSSTAHSALWFGARARFADVEEDTGNVSVDSLRGLIGPKTRALVPVDFAGRPADLEAVAALGREKGIPVISDACHSFGASRGGRKIGALADMTVLSFHPVKSITTGEGGAVLTDNPEFFKILSRFRHHGIEKGRDWEYSVVDLGVNGRLTDIHAALGISQLAKLDRFVTRRREIAKTYRAALDGRCALRLPPPSNESSWHLYVARVPGDDAELRRKMFHALRARGVQPQVHYEPIYKHPVYAQRGMSDPCPAAERFHAGALSLPIFPTLTDAMQKTVVEAVLGAAREVLPR